MTQPRLSATLIVRNEGRFLRDCLASLRGVADDVVVVDTGSTDTTRQIAVDAGARVFDFAWRDDFSAARNCAIDHAWGEWLLYIDADERVRPMDKQALASELSDRSVVARTVIFHPRTNFTAYREYRLFRREDDIRFEGAMHETMLPDLRRAAANSGRTISTSALTLDHVGYDGDQSHKLERNLNLLIKQIHQTPTRVYLWWHLGTVRRDLGDWAAAEGAWTEGVRLARLRGGAMAEDAKCFIELAKMRLERGGEALSLVDEGLSLRPENLCLKWLRAKALMSIGLRSEAVAIYHDLAAIDPDTLVTETAYDRRMLGAGAMADLGSIAFAAGDYRLAERRYSEAVERDPSVIEYRAKLALAKARADRAHATGGRST